MLSGPADLVRGDAPLPSLPEVYRRFSEKLEDPAADNADFADIVRSDPALAARVLRIVNSAYYSLSANVTDVAQAVSLIGLGDLRNLVLAVSVLQVFDGVPNQLVDMRRFWEHSIRCGLISRGLQKQRRGEIPSETLFTAGLVHDVGSLLIYNRLPELARSILEQAELEQRARHEVERELLGFDHAAVGASLLQHWRLPDFLVDVVGAHHAPQRAKVFAAEAMLIDIADQLAHAGGQADEHLLQELELNEAQLSAVFEQASDQFAELAAAILG